MEKGKERKGFCFAVLSDNQAKLAMTKFLLYCMQNPRCSELIEDALPELCMDGVTIGQNIDTIALFGSLETHFYEETKAYAKEHGWTKRSKCFYKLVDQLREILEPRYDNCEVVKVELGLDKL